MSSVSWIGGAAAVQDVWTLTPASVTVGNTFSVTIGGQTITFTATATTAANVTAGLYALLTSTSQPPDGQFRECTFTDNTGTLTIKVTTVGVPTIITTSTAVGSGSGSPTLAAVNTTAATGPNFWNNAANWSTGSLPTGADDVTVAGDADDILYGLDQHTITLNSLTINSKTIKIGLPSRNPNSYGEFRPTHLKISATTLNILQASGRVKIDNGTVQTTATIHATANSADSALGIPAVRWKGTNANNVLYALGGSVGLAFDPGEAATILTLVCDGATVTSYGSLTLTTVNVVGAGAVTLSSSMTTLNMQPSAANVSILGTAAITTANVYSGTLSYQSSGTIGTLNVSAYVTFEDDPRARTVTNATYYKGAKVRDRCKSVTHTNPVTLAGCSLKDVDLDYGLGRTYAIAG